MNKNIEPGHRVRVKQDNSTMLLVTGFYSDQFHNTGVVMGHTRLLTCQLHRNGYQIERVPFSGNWVAYEDPQELERLSSL